MAAKAKASERQWQRNKAKTAYQAAAAAAKNNGANQRISVIISSLAKSVAR